MQTNSILKKSFIATCIVALGLGLSLKTDLIPVASAETKYQTPQLETVYPHSRYAVIAKNTLPSVVSIKVERSVEYNFVSPFDDFFGFDDFFRPWGGNRRNTPKRKKHIQKGEGSGFIYNENGYIMTNNHVVDKADKIVVKTYDDHEYEAVIIGKDPETDLAVIKVDASFDEHQIATLGNSSNLWVGDEVIAIGSPLSLEQTVTKGIVSAKGRSGLGFRDGGPAFQDFIQTDAAINPGNSGGPLLDINGNVIGINAAVNASAQGIGFAIPIDLAKKIEKQLRETGEIKRGFIGIALRELSADEKEPYGVENDICAILIADVEANSPGEKAGLKKDDIIIKYEGNYLEGYDQLRFKIASNMPGDKINLTVLRESEEEEIRIILGDRAKLLGHNSEDEIINESLLGMEIKNIDREIKKITRYPLTRGVFIESISDKSIANGKIFAGDIIIKIIFNGRHYLIKDTSDFEEIAEKISKSNKSFVIKYFRKGREEITVIKR